MKKELFICPNSTKECSSTCYHKTPHSSGDFCYSDKCGLSGKKIGICIPYKSKKSTKRYSLKQLYNLWIEWAEKIKKENFYNLSTLKFFEKNGLDSSFIKWLEEREKNEEKR
jgi:hypothetical protein